MSTRSRFLRIASALLALTAVATTVATTACSTATTGPAAPAAAPALPAALPAATAPAPAPVRPVTVPLSHDGQRLALDVDVAGTVLHVLVDTGSSGLRVAATKLPAGSVAVSGPAKPVTFVSGERLTGLQARAPIRVGAVPGTSPVPIQLVTGSDCVPEHPDCGATDGPGILGGRFDGIIGLNARSGDDVPNPLWYLGEVGHAYTVRYDPAGASTLVLGDPADGVALQPLRRTAPATDGGAGPPAWDPHYPLCAVADRVPTGRLCADGGLDTGNPALADLRRPGGPDLPFPPGTPVTVGTADGSWSAAFVTGPGRSVDLAATEQASSSGRIGLGLPALAGSDLRTDLAAGTIGLRRR